MLTGLVSVDKFNTHSVKVHQVRMEIFNGGDQGTLSFHSDSLTISGNHLDLQTSHGN